MLRTICVMSLLVFVGGCANLPEVTRTGKVVNVVIRDGIDPQIATVAVGDEVRWFNQRTGDVKIEFIEPISDVISCNDRFYVLGSLGTSNIVALAPNETASLCFKLVGTRRYVVRVDSTRPTGEKNLTGSVEVQ